MFALFFLSFWLVLVGFLVFFFLVMTEVLGIGSITDMWQVAKFILSYFSTGWVRNYNKCLGLGFLKQCCCLISSVK